MGRKEHAVWEPELAELERRKELAVEDIIDPAETRPVLTEWVHDAYAALTPGPHPTTRP